MKHTRIEGHWGYVKDNNGAVLNINKEEIEAAKRRKEQRRNQQKELNTLKDEVSDIKKMLTQIVEKLNG